MNRKLVEEFVEQYIEDEKDFEELLQEFDLTLVDAFMCLFDSGLIDEDVLSSLSRL